MRFSSTMRSSVCPSISSASASPRGAFLATPRDKKAPRALARALEIDGETELRTVDEKRMAKVYVAPPAELQDIPQLGRLGVEILSADFTRERDRKSTRL